ncbi:Ankyrin-1 [Cercospora beticola]|uniref:Ankyrin-1 n=1 Tax=Cercospora beticola TaxID=122368 RepID=A0A2G5HZC1_CERBT|nr:Ankyrin-1 [Cercospora beticola]PIA97895.1 Ankyrin-1 [Cercospora beticola]WPA99223.1 hypothetical protein RHO25_003839 [Cercospora beticola]
MVDDQKNVRFVRGFVGPEPPKVDNAEGEKGLELLAQTGAIHDESTSAEKPRSPAPSKELVQVIYDAVAADDTENLRRILVQHWWPTDPVSMNSWFLKTSRQLGTDGNSSGILHGAAELNGMRITQKLLAAGFDVNARNAVQSTPLHCAAYNGHVEMVEYLLRSGANPGLSCRHGSTALHLLLGGKQDKEDSVHAVAKLLLKHDVPIDEPNSMHHTALTLSARRGFKLVAEQLLAHGASVNGSPGEWGPTPLMEACNNQLSIELVLLFLKNGASPNLCRPLKKGGRSVTALALACSCMKSDGSEGSERYQIVSHLLSAGADANMEGCSATDAAAKRAHVDIVQLLRQSGADRAYEFHTPR